MSFIQGGYWNYGVNHMRNRLEDVTLCGIPIKATHGAKVEWTGGPAGPFCERCTEEARNIVRAEERRELREVGEQEFKLRRRGG
jgi:hypothetical protein